MDRAAKSVEVSCFGGRTRLALFRPDLGATLVFGSGLAPSSPSGARSGVRSRLPWPLGDGPHDPQESEAIGRVVDAAFTEINPRKPRRTRAVLVAVNGGIVAERYASGFGPLTPLPGWSMAKSVLGALIGVLTADKRLALGQTDLLEEWRSPKDLRSKISLEDLLRMRSGLDFAEAYSDPLSDVARMLFASPDAAGFAAAKPLAWAPGSLWRYSSGTTNILSFVMRRALGEAGYAGFPRAALFAPLGMNSAVLEPDESGTFVFSSFMHATARDWARFGELCRRDGNWNGRQILPAGWAGFCASPTPQSPAGSYGAHWWLKLPKELGGQTAAALRIPSDAFFALGHEGQTLTVIPSRGLVVVRLGLSIRADAWDQAAFVADILDAPGNHA